MTGWHHVGRWHDALRIANERAAATGWRYRVRRSHANPSLWLVMMAWPRQVLGGQK